LKPPIKLNEPDEAKFHNIIDMALGFSGMMRLFEKKSKNILRDKMISDIPTLLSVKSEREFIDCHASFCRWGVNTIVLAEKVKNGKVTKHSGPASYGQIAKTLNVVLKVVVYYCRLPSERAASVIGKWLEPAVDTKMMAYLKPKNSSILWPMTIEQVGFDEYEMLNGAVGELIQDCHQGKIAPVQFDDIYWEALNDKNAWHDGTES